MHRIPALSPKSRALLERSHPTTRRSPWVVAVVVSALLVVGLAGTAFAIELTQTAKQSFEGY